MSSILDTFRTLLPPRAKASPSGWISFNAPCCHHRGHNQDKRKRAGVMFSDGITFNCFNCKYSATWKPGRPISFKFKTLLQWLGASDSTIANMVFEALKTEATDETYEYKPLDFEEKDLPDGAMPLLDWCHEPYLSTAAELLSPVLNYLTDRKFDPFSGDFYWSPAPGYENRVIIPFRYQGKIVGSTARKVTEGRPKYISDQSPNFVFNLDKQAPDLQYTFVVEGPFDAISVDGVAVLTNRISESQSQLINSIGSNIIVIPDQDEAGLELIQSAIDNNYSVAFPTWEDDVKDVAEAVGRYGKLFVTIDAINTAVSGEIKIKVQQKYFEAKLNRTKE
jgi:hypothetical protein